MKKKKGKITAEGHCYDSQTWKWRSWINGGRLRIGLAMIGVVVLFSACYEPIEGCLDVEATNFDVTADRVCPDDCCKYPQLSLQITHGAGSNNLSFDSIYRLENDQLVQIKQFQFYLTEFHLVRADGTEQGVNDRIDVSVLTNTGNQFIEVEDNFLLIRRQTASYPVGEIRGEGVFTAVRFLVGIDPEVNSADPAFLPQTHPLSPQADTMHWSQQAGYIFNKITVRTDTTSENCTTYEIGSIPNLVEVELPASIELTRGTNLSVALRIDYLKWFKGINFEENEVEIRRQIVINTASAFSIAK